MNYFPSNLKALSKYSKLTQEELAILVGKKRSVIGSYMRGDTQPNIEALLGISDAFGIDLNTLIYVDIEKKLEEVDYIPSSVKELQVHLTRLIRPVFKYGIPTSESDQLDQLIRSERSTIQILLATILDINDLMQHLNMAYHEKGGLQYEIDYSKRLSSGFLRERFGHTDLSKLSSEDKLEYLMELNRGSSFFKNAFSSWFKTLHLSIVSDHDADH